VGPKPDDDDVEARTKRAPQQHWRAKRQGPVVPNVHDLGSRAFEALGDDDVA
jgi:hypothetical protein